MLSSSSSSAFSPRTRRPLSADTPRPPAPACRRCASVSVSVKNPSPRTRQVRGWAGRPPGAHFLLHRPLRVARPPDTRTDTPPGAPSPPQREAGADAFASRRPKRRRRDIGGVALSFRMMMKLVDFNLMARRSTPRHAAPRRPAPPCASLRRRAPLTAAPRPVGPPADAHHGAGGAVHGGFQEEPRVRAAACLLGYGGGWGSCFVCQAAGRVKAGTTTSSLPPMDPPGRTI